MALKSLLTLASASLAAAHFGVEYPEWRANTLSLTNETGFDQWEYPCGGVPSEGANRTEWPLDGGSVKLELHHPWTYVFVNLGLSANVTNFNVSLTPQLLNTTSEGTLCLEKLTLPSTVSPQDGDLASLQIITVDGKGSSLYNCADIRFSSNAATLPAAECADISVDSYIVQEANNGNNNNNNNNNNNGDNDSAAASLATSASGLLIVAAAAAFTYGMGA